MVWIKIDLTALNAPAATVEYIAEFLLQRPDNILSITKNIAETEAWIKLSVDPELNGLYPGVVLDKATTPAEHLSKVQADIYSVDWPSE